MDDEFQGGVFHASLPGGRWGATLRVTRTEVVAETVALDAEFPAGTAQVQRFAIPLSQCVLDLGGASGRMVFCRTTDGSLTLFSEAPGFAQALERNSHGLLTEQLAALRGKQRREGRRFLTGATVFAIVTSLLLVAGYYGMMAAARSAVTALPLSFDEKIGRMAIESMDVGERLDSDHPASVLVTRIVDQLKPHAKIPEMDFRARVVRKDDVNAFALPGGQIVVFSGLIEKADSAEQLAGVLAHEMAHATLRHGMQSVGQSLGIVAAVEFMIGDVGGLLALGSQVAQESILTSYSRRAETEADLEGARMLHAAGLDPHEMASFFEKLKKDEGDLPGLVAWISTHPQHEDRVRTISEYEGTLERKEYHKLEVDLERARAALRGESETDRDGKTVENRE